MVCRIGSVGILSQLMPVAAGAAFGSTPTQWILTTIGTAWQEGGEAPGGSYAYKFFSQPPGVLEVDPDELPPDPEFNGFTHSAGSGG